MTFVSNFRMILICPILTFRSSLFIVNGNLIFYGVLFLCYIHCIAYMICYNFLMALTNSLSDISSKLGSCFYVFQTMFLTVNFLHSTYHPNFFNKLYPFLWIIALLYNFKTQLLSELTSYKYFAKTCHDPL